MNFFFTTPLQMITKAQIDKFYQDLEELGLKFPVAAVCKATMFSKGMVSPILKREMEPTENFLKAFYNSSLFVQPPVSQGIFFTKEELIQLFRDIAKETSGKVENEMKETKKALREHNIYLQGLVNSNLAEIEKWSFATLVDLQANVYYQAEREAQGEKNVRDQILAKQGKIAGEIRGQLKSIGKKAAASNKDKD